jgi:hypothetical protein
MSQTLGASGLRSNEGVDKFVESCSVKNPRSYSQVHWGEVPKWIKSVLGDGCNIVFQELHIEGTKVDALWHLTGVKDIGSDLVVRVRVETQVGDREGGKLNLEKSCSACVDHLAIKIIISPLSGLPPTWTNTEIT